MLALRLIREPSRNGATLGSLYVNGVWQCWTLEDEIREVAAQPVAQWKVPGRTAIPAGMYRVAVTPSARFKRPLPLLLDVPGFSGIRIHPGNTPPDTEGCLLVGAARAPGKVLQSTAAFLDLFPLIEAAAGNTWIAIQNPVIDVTRSA